MKLDKETVLELMNEAASYHGPMISVSKERIIDLCDTALYAVAPVPEGGRINAVPILQRIRKQRDELADVLRWLDSRGGLGLDVHARIAKALEGIPTYEQQLRNIAEGIGMTYEELMAAASSLPQLERSEDK